MLRDVLNLVVLVVAVMFGLSILMLGGRFDLNAFMAVNELLRTAAALGLFVLGVLAYRKWWRPENARRRGDAAQEILRLSRTLEGRLLAARPFSFTLKLEGKVGEAAEKAGVLREQDVPRRELRKLEETYNEFQTYHAEAGFLFHGSKAADLMAELEAQAEEVRKAWRIIAMVKSGGFDHLLDNPRIQGLVDATMETANVVFVDREGGEPPDVFKDKVQDTGKNLRDVLLPYLAGE